MARIARISTSVQQALTNVFSTQYVLIILVLTAADVKKALEEMQSANADVSFV